MTRRRPDDDDRDDMRRLRAAGASLGEVAAETGFGVSTVHRIVADVPVDARARANRARAAKPPPWLKRARALLARGQARHAVALTLGVPMTTLYRAIERFGAGPTIDKS